MSPCKVCGVYNCTSSHTEHQKYQYYKPYTPTTPMDGLDCKKWPHTYNLLTKLYYSREWHLITKYVRPKSGIDESRDEFWYNQGYYYEE